MAPTFSLSVVFFLNEGHTTMNCPHRVATEHGVVPAPRKSTRHSVDYIFERQLRPHVPAVSCLLYIWPSFGGFIMIVLLVGFCTFIGLEVAFIVCCDIG